MEGRLLRWGERLSEELDGASKGFTVWCWFSTDSEDVEDSCSRYSGENSVWVSAVDPPLSGASEVEAECLGYVDFASRQELSSCLRSNGPKYRNVRANKVKET